MEIRALREGEREPLLELLDGWEMADGWQGRDFFRRYLELDPDFRDENVWIAADRGVPVACVQVFPRRLRSGRAEIPLGGIGSVYTHAEHRRTGLAGAVLARAEQALRDAGVPLGMLFTGRLDFYGRRGWHVWPFARALYLRKGESPAPRAGEEWTGFDPARDLDAVRAIHAGYSGARDGTLVRDARGWQGNLAYAGNPDEDFRVARRGGEPVAYARTIVLEDHPVLMEFGRRPAAAGELAGLLASGFARGGAYGPAPADPELEAALGERGVSLRLLPDPSSMLRCLDAPALAAAAGLELRPGESESDLLRRVLPPERCLFWPADRF